jgi:hypothetical protein
VRPGSSALSAAQDALEFEGLKYREIGTPALLRTWFADESIPIAVRIAVVVAGVGGVMLVLSVVREQFTARRKDRYAKGVTR